METPYDLLRAVNSAFSHRSRFRPTVFWVEDIPEWDAFLADECLANFSGFSGKGQGGGDLLASGPRAFRVERFGRDIGLVYADTPGTASCEWHGDGGAVMKLLSSGNASGSGGDGGGSSSNADSKDAATEAKSSAQPVLLLRHEKQGVPPLVTPVWTPTERLFDEAAVFARHKNSVAAVSPDLDLEAAREAIAWRFDVTQSGLFGVRATAAASPCGAGHVAVLSKAGHPDLSTVLLAGPLDEERFWTALAPPKSEALPTQLRATGQPSAVTVIRNTGRDRRLAGTSSKRSSGSARGKEAKRPVAEDDDAARGDSGSGGDDYDSGESWEVDSILQHRVRGGQLEFRLRWKGFPVSQATWEPSTSIKTREVIDGYKLLVRARMLSAVIVSLIAWLRVTVCAACCAAPASHGTYASTSGSPGCRGSRGLFVLFVPATSSSTLSSGFGCEGQRCALERTRQKAFRDRCASRLKRTSHQTQQARRCYGGRCSFQRPWQR